MDIVFDPAQEVEPIEFNFWRSVKNVGILVADEHMNTLLNTELLSVTKMIKKDKHYKANLTVRGDVYSAVVVSTEVEKAPKILANVEFLILAIGANPVWYPIAESVIIEYKKKHKDRIYLAIGYDDGFIVDDSLIEFANKYEIEAKDESLLSTAVYKAVLKI